MAKELAVETKTTDLFNSPTHGKVGWLGMLDRVASFMDEDAEAKYRVVIGTDSGGRQRGGIDFITAIVIHHIGRGAIYFWKKTHQDHPLVLRQRMYTEALISLEMAEALIQDFQKLGFLRHDLEIHVDVGQAGDTRDMISELVGMVKANGFSVKTKPRAYAASTVADRHT